jgi:lipoyl-dependent peroxiredoxin subunit D
MGLDALKEALPPYARDLKLNLSSVLGTSTLPVQQVWGTALAVAMASGSPRLIAELEPAARAALSEEATTAAKAAAAVMAMNNVYYRSMHQLDDEAYATLPAKLRMSVIGNPGIDKVDFELWCLAVSAVNGCQRCLGSHERELRGAGVPRETVHEAVRIAAVVHAVGATLEAEAAAVPA